MRRTVLGLLKASHPEPGGAVTAVATLLAIAIGQPALRVVLVAATVASSQLAVGLSNDWLDADRDRAVGRTDKPVATGEIDRRPVGIAAVVCAAATVPFGLTLGWRAALAALVGLGSALLYNWRVKFTAFSVVPYMVSFATLPAFVVLALPGAPSPPAWLVAAGGLLGGGAHFANVLPDLTDDLATGVRGLPHRLGAAGSRLAAVGLLLAATLLLVLGPPGRPSWTGLAAIAAALVVLPIGGYASRRALRRGARPVAAFRAVLVVALIDVLLLVASGRLI